MSGGWYDAGDYGKYTVSGSIAVWQLLKVIELLQGVADRLAVLSQPTLVDIADAFDLQGFDFTAWLHRPDSTSLLVARSCPTMIRLSTA